MRHPIALDHGRRARAAHELHNARVELDGRLSPDHPSVPPWYGRRVLAADDEFGRAAGLVVQGERISWSAIDAMAELAMYGTLAHRWLTHNGEVDPSCARCAQSTAWQASLLERTFERSEATTAQLRDALAAELATVLPARPVDIRFGPGEPGSSQRRGSTGTAG
ncbi:MAG: hypothetical protein ABI140_01045 [Jatrophihabitantaceae bacterium]